RRTLPPQGDPGAPPVPGQPGPPHRPPGRTRPPRSTARCRLPPTDVDPLPAVVEEVQRLHADRDGQRMPAGHRRVRREPYRQLGRPAVVPSRVAEPALAVA